MKLYYDKNTGNLIEAGTYENDLFIRYEDGNVEKVSNFDNLVEIGDIYNEPIKLTGSLLLSKVIDGKIYGIQSGFASEKQVEEGSRFVVKGRGFSFYSTNIVTGIKKLSDKLIDFYTLSGTHYRIEIIAE
jgi:hypothetical protein